MPRQSGPTARYAPPIERSVRLPDGRRLSFSEHGCQSGKPVFFLHGAPGSRYQHHPDTAIAERLNLRLIIPERPGYGRSEPHPGRTLASFVADVRFLADSLGIERFAVAAWSMGSIYALACAHYLPERVERLASMGSLAPIEAPGMADADSIGLRLLHGARDAPEELVKGLRAIADAPDRLAAFIDPMPEPDHRIARAAEVAQAMRRDLAEAIRQGFQALVSDYVIAGQPWGFPLAAISQEVHLWHGDADVNVASAMSEYLARELPHAHLTVCPGEGHLLHFPRWQEMLAVLSQ